jgi:hypothetical protein
MHFIDMCVKNQQMQHLFIQFINYVWYLLQTNHFQKKGKESDNWGELKEVKECEKSSESAEKRGRGRVVHQT